VIDVKEHRYDDDPNLGPPDVRTELKNVDYFFLGNGLIQAAVQAAPGGDGTPVGLLIMNPDKLRKKRDALTMDPRSGLKRTAITIAAGGEIHEAKPGSFRARWSRSEQVPTVIVRWKSGPVSVEERFLCPRRNEPVILRMITIRNRSGKSLAVGITTGIRRSKLEKDLVLKRGAGRRLFIRYLLDPEQDSARAEFVDEHSAGPDVRRYGKSLSRISFGDSQLDHYFRASKFQLPAAVSRLGRVDGGVWQYNREWLRDQAMAALALTMAGDHGLARTMFNRLLGQFVTGEGDTIDSSEKRHPDEVELDQNGFLLYTLKDYVLWSGDLDIVRRNWDKIAVAAEFPLRAIFRHEPSGLLMNRREFWERHRAHGIEPGLELVHQLYTSHGLQAASVLARMTGRNLEADRWDREARRVKKAMLEDPVFRLADERGFIKRRGTDGNVQEKIEALSGSGLPSESPLARPGDHFLNPDTSSALPIALGFVPPQSPLCRRTLASLETLWNQAWTGGGYGRYHAGSEPDSPGAWPFPTLFVARACVEFGDYDNVRRILNWLGTVPGAGAGTWFEFYGKRQAPPFPQVGIVPWNWAEMIVLCVHHILGIQPQENGLRIRPKLLPGLKTIRASFPFRKGRLTVDIQKKPGARKAAFETNAEVLASHPGEILTAYTDGGLWVKAVL